jgi:hypothetical protein
LITPECCPNAKSILRLSSKLIISLLASPKGYAKILGVIPNYFLITSIEDIRSFLTSKISYDVRWA